MSSVSINNSLTCAPCISNTNQGQKCKEPVWKEDLFYTGHSQVPMENSEGLGTCCCEKTPDPPPLCNHCSSCPNAPGQAFDIRQLFQTRSIKSNISRYREKVKGKGGICSIA